MKLTAYTDGASRGNPGNAGIGAVIYNEKEEIIAELSEYIGESTNNVAEYTAVIRALETGLELGGVEITLYTDSELLTKQILGSYKVRNEGLIPLYKQVLNLKAEYDKFAVVHVKREFNKLADKLANQAVDKATKA
ncbi:MAG: ribonuclease HI family protein [Bacillota bacterium]|nr:ribonuclease HI family protein [Bacillota bacterium]